jgi:hypothetical protein
MATLEDFPIGTRVRTTGEVRTRRFAKVSGLVLFHNEGEVGVRLGSPASHTSPVWFRPSELIPERD